MPGNKFIFIFYINYFLNKKIDSKIKFLVKKKKLKIFIKYIVIMLIYVLFNI